MPGRRGAFTADEAGASKETLRMVEAIKGKGYDVASATYNLSSRIWTIRYGWTGAIAAFSSTNKLNVWEKINHDL